MSEKIYPIIDMTQHPLFKGGASWRNGEWYVISEAGQPDIDPETGRLVCTADCREVKIIHKKY